MSLLPPNASQFEKALAYASEHRIDFKNRDLWNPYNCPEPLLYVLAITLDVDEWDELWAEHAKRQTLIDAHKVHTKKGTPSSIRRVLRNAGYHEIELIEGLNIQKRDSSVSRAGHYFRGSDEANYMYRIYLTKAITLNQAKQVTEIINETASLHCELAGLHYNQAQFLRNATIFHNGVYSRGTV